MVVIQQVLDLIAMGWRLAQAAAANANATGSTTRSRLARTRRITVIDSSVEVAGAARLAAGRHPSVAVPEGRNEALPRQPSHRLTGAVTPPSRSYPRRDGSRSPGSPPPPARAAGTGRAPGPFPRRGW